MEQQDQSIKVRFNTKIKFDKLQLAYKEKGMKKDQDQMVDMLINISKEFNKVLPLYSKALKELKEIKK